MIPQYWRGTMNDRTTQIIPKKSAENPADCETNDSTFAWDRSLGKCRPNQLGIDRRGAILPKIINMTPAPEEIIRFMLTGFAWTVPKKIINNTSTMISIRIKDKDAENTPLLHPFLLTCTVSLLLPRKLSRSAVTIDINRTAIMTATIISSHLDPHRSIFPSKPIWTGTTAGIDDQDMARVTRGMSASKYDIMDTIDVNTFFFHLFFLFTKIVRLSPVIFGQIHEINN